MTTARKKNVALISVDGHVGISTPVINTAKYLAMEGFNVDLYIVKSKIFKPPVFNNKNINVVILNILFNKFIIREIEIAMKYFKPPQKYHFLIGYDPGGLISTGIINIIWRVPFVYHNLELFTVNRGDSWKHSIIKVLERWFSKRALFVLSQDKERANILAKDNALERGKVLISCNSPMGNVLPEKYYFFHEKFNISKEKKIVLAVGSLIKEHSIDKIIGSINEWPSEFVLVLHGWFPYRDFEQMIRNEAEQSRGRVFISTQLLNNDEKHIIFQSADIGLVFFEPININLLYAAGSASKLYDFMRTGVPIIANDLPGMKEIVENNNIGIVVKDASKIKYVLPEIMNNYSKLRNNELNNFDRFKFESTFSIIIKKICSSLMNMKNIKFEDNKY